MSPKSLDPILLHRMQKYSLYIKGHVRLQCLRGHNPIILWTRFWWNVLNPILFGALIFMDPKFDWTKHPLTQIFFGPKIGFDQKRGVVQYLLRNISAVLLIGRYKPGTKTINWGLRTARDFWLLICQNPGYIGNAWLASTNRMPSLLSTADMSPLKFTMISLFCLTDIFLDHQ